MAHRVLILGGTTEARELARRLCARGIFDIVLSLAGRTKSPVAQGVPTRVGGFGGAGGLAQYLRAENIAMLVDATHPFAARISANAVAAAREARVPLTRLVRPAWKRLESDRWIECASVGEAAARLGEKPRAAFVALGRQELAPLLEHPQHRYVIRSVDPIDPPLEVPSAAYILARGPFDESDERAMLLAHGVDCVIAKNSGGAAVYGKIAAARALGLEVFIIRRPDAIAGPAAAAIDEAIAMIDHALAPPVKERGE